MSIFLIGLAALGALTAYNHQNEADPEGTHEHVNGIFQGAELIRTVAAFVTSIFLVFRGSFRPQGMNSGLRPQVAGGGPRFGRANGDDD
jgi:hypothetical protein